MCRQALLVRCARLGMQHLLRNKLIPGINQYSQGNHTGKDSVPGFIPLSSLPSTELKLFVTPKLNSTGKVGPSFLVLLHK